MTWLAYNLGRVYGFCAGFFRGMLDELHDISGRRKEKIITTHVYPPIPIRSSDWCAHRDGYEPGCLIGWGATEQEAIDELLQLEEEEHD